MEKKWTSKGVFSSCCTSGLWAWLALSSAGCVATVKPLYEGENVAVVRNAAPPMRRQLRLEMGHAQQGTAEMVQPMRTEETACDSPCRPNQNGPRVTNVEISRPLPSESK